MMVSAEELYVIKRDCIVVCPQPSMDFAYRWIDKTKKEQSAEAQRNEPMRDNLRNALRNWAAHNRFNLPSDFKVKYRNDTLGGCAVEITTPTGEHVVYVLSVVEKRAR